MPHRLYQVNKGEGESVKGMCRYTYDILKNKEFIDYVLKHLMQWSRTQASTDHLYCRKQTFLKFLFLLFFLIDAFYIIFSVLQYKFPILKPDFWSKCLWKCSLTPHVRACWFFLAKLALIFWSIKITNFCQQVLKYLVLLRGVLLFSWSFRAATWWTLKGLIWRTMNM